MKKYESIRLIPAFGGGWILKYEEIRKINGGEFCNTEYTCREEIFEKDKDALARARELFDAESSEEKSEY